MRAGGRYGPAGSVGEEVAHAEAELADERVERAHAGVDLVALDLRDEAGGDADAAGELAEAEAELLALRAQARADVRRLVGLGAAR